MNACIAQLTKTVLLSFMIALVCSPEASAQQVTGSLKKWQPVTIDFTGPSTSETAINPNPFLDYRFTAWFKSPSGIFHKIPGYYAGNGQGGGSGSVWRVRFVPDESGVWDFSASFRQGAHIALEEDANAGTPVSFDSVRGTMTIAAFDPQAAGNWSKGLLRPSNTHYYQYQNGEHFLKIGINSPENFLAFKGFDNTIDTNGGFVHEFATHRAHWRPGDPTFGANPELSKNIVGAINYLADQGLNSIYTMLMNIGGDGEDTFPFVSPANTSDAKLHYDVSKLDQWQTVMEHAQSRGMLMHLVLAENESGNVNWLDQGGLGVERKLMLREMIARFGYLPAVQWNLREENTWASDTVQAMAQFLQVQSSRDDLIGIHNTVGLGLDSFEYQFHWMYGNPLYAFASVQFYEDDMVESLKRAVERSKSAGKPWVVGMDESDQASNEDNADERRKKMIYEVLFNKGQLEWYQGISRDTTEEDFTDEEPLWRFSRYARKFFNESQTPWWTMVDADHLNSAAEVLADPGRDYLHFFQGVGSRGRLNLEGVEGVFRIRWFNPRNGEWTSWREQTNGGTIWEIPWPPNYVDRSEDWLAHVHRMDIPLPTPTQSPQSGLINGSFEMGTNGWLKSPDISAADYSAVDCGQWGSCRHGSHYLKVTVANDSVAPYDPHVSSEWVETGTALSGRIYELAFDIRSHQGSHSVKGVSLQRFPHWESAEPWAQTAVYLGDIAATESWQRITTTLVFPRAKNGNPSSQLRVILRGIDDNTNTPVYYDNVVITDKGAAREGDITGDGQVTMADFARAKALFSTYGLLEFNRVIRNLLY